MQPRQPTPELSSSASFERPEYAAAGDGTHIESPTRTPEALPQVGERATTGGAAIADATFQAQASVLPAPIAPFSNTVTATLTSDDNPLLASDEDLIEKEWVDKTKKIILETKDDPFKREQEIAKLHIDYIKKRYGRTIGESSVE